MLKILTVLGLGAIELWISIPAGLAFQLSPTVTCIVSALGAIMGVLIILLLGEKVRSWFLNRYKRKKGTNKNGRMQQIWQRYGVPGLGLLAPLITGAPLGVIIGLSLGARVNQLFFWAGIGIIIWSIILTYGAALGLSLFF